MPCRTQAGTTSCSGSRCSRLKWFCALTNRARPRFSETDSASSICSPEKLELPISRTLPSRTRRSRAVSVSSIGTLGSGPCCWYRSMRSVPRRRRLPSTASATQRAPAPAWLGASAIGGLVPALRERTRRTQAERRAASQERLLEAAATLVATRGTARASLGDIAATAGCSRGLPTYLFGSKEGLLLALADYLVERFRTRLFEPALEQRRGLPALLIWLRVYVQGLRGPELQVRAACVLLGEALGSEPAFLPAINRLHRNVRSMVEHYLREGVERGEVRA